MYIMQISELLDAYNKDFEKDPKDTLHHLSSSKQLVFYLLVNIN